MKETNPKHWLPGVEGELKIKEAGMKLTTQIRQAGIDFGLAFEEAAKTMREFGDAVQRAARKQYLQEHGRLPGSERTSRLRKKRRDAVERFVFKE
jgi:hypothetical protein